MMNEVPFAQHKWPGRCFFAGHTDSLMAGAARASVLIIMGRALLLSKVHPGSARPGSAEHHATEVGSAYLDLTQP